MFEGPEPFGDLYVLFNEGLRRPQAQGHLEVLDGSVVVPGAPEGYSQVYVRRVVAGLAFKGLPVERYRPGVELERLSFHAFFGEGLALRVQGEPESVADELVRWVHRVRLLAVRYRCVSVVVDRFNSDVRVGYPRPGVPCRGILPERYRVFVDEGLAEGQGPQEREEKGGRRGSHGGRDPRSGPRRGRGEKAHCPDARHVLEVVGDERELERVYIDEAEGREDGDEEKGHRRRRAPSNTARGSEQ